MARQSSPSSIRAPWSARRPCAGEIPTLGDRVHLPEVYLQRGGTVRFRWKKRERSRACREVHRNWWAVLDSNQRPPDQKAGANAVTLCFSSVHCDSYAILLLHRKSGPNSELRYIAFHWRSYARLTTVPLLYLAGWHRQFGGDGVSQRALIDPRHRWRLIARRRFRSVRRLSSR